MKVNDERLSDEEGSAAKILIVEPAASVRFVTVKVPKGEPGLTIEPTLAIKLAMVPVPLTVPPEFAVIVPPTVPALMN